MSNNYIICIESSKTRGMGHLFRSFSYAEYMNTHNLPYTILINNDPAAIKLLEEKNLPFEVIDFDDTVSDWETEAIERHKANVWVEDKFESTEGLVKHVAQNCGVLFCMIDEFGDYAKYSDLHFAGMMYPSKRCVNGRKTFCGPEFIVINKEVDVHKRLRSEVKNIIVTLGGSDPYGVTVDVVKEISRYDYNVEVVIGPDFAYEKELRQANSKNYSVKSRLPSLIAEFDKFDFAITGGGGTPCEAIACGVPCMIISNAPHEINTGRYLEDLETCIYAGNHDNWSRSYVEKISSLDIEDMSRKGMNFFDSGAIDRIFDTIEDYRNSETMMRSLRENYTNEG